MNSKLETFYISPEDEFLFERFKKYIEKDSRLDKLKSNELDLTSIAITQIIIKYIDDVENEEVPSITRAMIKKITEEFPEEINKIVDIDNKEDEADEEEEKVKAKIPDTFT